MKKTVRKLLAVAMSVTLVMNALPMSAFAESDPPATGTDVAVGSAAGDEGLTTEEAAPPSAPEELPGPGEGKDQDDTAGSEETAVEDNPAPTPSANEQETPPAALQEGTVGAAPQEGAPSAEPQADATSAAPHAHEFGTEWQSDDANHWHECTAGDGERADEAAHAFGDWATAKEATETEPGSRERACTVCGYAETAAIPALEMTGSTDESIQAEQGVQAADAQDTSNSLRGPILTAASEYAIGTTVKDDVGGSVYVRTMSDSAPLTSAEADKPLIVIATPESGYTLSGLYLLRAGDPAPAAPYSIQLSPIGTAYSFAMPAYDVTVYAVFEDTSTIPKQKSFTLYFNSGTNGVGAQRSVVLEETSLGDGIEYTFPDYSSLGFTPNPGYGFAGWLYGDDNTLYMPGDTINVTSDKAIFGQCAEPRTFTVTFSAWNQELADGRMEDETQTSMPPVTVKEGHYGEGASYILPQPGFVFNEDGYTFLHYECLNNMYLPGDTIILDRDAVRVTAIYTNATEIYQVTVTSSGGGTARSTPAQGSNGQDIMLAATPDSGYRFKEWIVKSGGVALDSSSSATTKFSINAANVEIEAVFESLSRTVSVSADPAEGGTVTGGGTVTEGQETTVTATANAGYVFDGWYEGTTKVTAEATYSFTPTGDRDLVARFRKSTQITVSYWDSQPFTASRGDRLLIQGRLQDAQGNNIGGRELTLSLEGNTYTNFTSHYSHSLGHYSFYVYPLQVGAGEFEISFAGDETYAPTSVQCDIDVKHKTLSELVVDPVEPIEPDGQVTISGRLLDEDGKGISGAEISMDSFGIRGQNGKTFHLPRAQTDAGGSFSTTGYWEGGSDLFRLGGTIDIYLTYQSDVYANKDAYLVIPVVNPAIAVSAEVVWDDVDDADGVRPDSVWLTLRRADGRPVVGSDGQPVTVTKELSGDAGDGVGVTWDNLPKYHVENRKTTPITYEIVQTDASGQAWTPEGYTLATSGNMKDGFTFTNTHPHTHQMKAVAEVEPTCTTAGAEAHWTCTSCHRLFSDEGGTTRISAPAEIPALGHDWGAWTVTKAATCTAEGTEVRACKHDATHTETREATVDPDAHSWGEWSLTKAPTCTEKGTETRTCKHDPNHTETQDVAIDPDAHKWGEWVVTKAATCTEKGEETRTCKHDPTHTQTQDVAIDQDAHDWGEWVVTKEPTCTAKGEETRTCKHDPTHMETRELAIDSDAHDWDEWVVTKKSTETEEGSETRTCKHDAAHKETRSIPKLDPEAITYRSTKGDGAVWTRGSATTLDFTFERSEDNEATFDHFVGIEVDGKPVDAKHYTARSGSVIVGLKATYLETLAVGDHTLEALFDDGDAVSASFRIAAKEEGPSTPDDEKDQTPGDNTDGSNKENEGDSGKDDKDTRDGADSDAGNKDGKGGQNGTGGKNRTGGSNKGTGSGASNANSDTGKVADGAGNSANDKEGGTRPLAGSGSTSTPRSTSTTATSSSTTGTSTTGSTNSTATKAVSPNTGDQALPWPGLMMLAGVLLATGSVSRRQHGKTRRS